MSLTATQRTARALLHVAARPLPDDYAEPDAVAVRLSRRDLFTLCREAGLDLGLHAFGRALDEIAALDHTEALRLVRHGGTVTAVVGLLHLDDDVDLAWDDGILVDLDDDSLEEIVEEIPRQPLPLDLLRAPRRAPVGTEPRPVKACAGPCGRERSVDDFTHRANGRPLAKCRECRAAEARDKRATDPRYRDERTERERAYVPRSRYGRPYGPRRGFSLS
ncbi:hypothetical protein [Knoellia koreensis]|uniref:Uncharacterized protein n=1 Tax=Knoellia koreensis TaxID=2730921 RepID=A0A849HIK9_9MICO|nr:hypothetical protein [Knoellia sp. DB2414S]NNM44527.1 hypothetical protein [Knoellia sp. DB2414S]